MTNLSFYKNPTQEDIDVALKEVAPEPYLNIPLRLHYTSHNHFRHQMIHHHWHNEMEILFLSKGTLQMNIEDASFIIESGDIVVIPPRYLHSGTNIYSQDCDFYAIVFDLKFISSLENDSIQKNYIDPILSCPIDFSFYIKNNQKLYLILNNIIQKYAAKSTGWDLYTKLQLLLFFYELLNDTTDKLAYTPSHKKLKLDNSSSARKIISYIEKNFTGKISLSEIATFTGFNKEYFCRFFKKQFGISFSKYLSQYRIQKAEYLLIHTDKKIIDVTFEVGFDNTSYFSKVFKEITGYTPNEYRLFYKENK